jgi:dTDP-4-amino-4,6-dideoxygalactose transaminase
MIRFNEPFVTGRELDYIRDVVFAGAFGGDGKFARRCQELLEQRLGAAHALLTHSCTAALEVAALALRLGPGDEVILPSYTFCATATAFLRTGARLVFCEIDPGTMMMDAADVERRITPRTRAVVPVHYCGVACDLGALMPLASRHGLDVVEDAAQGVDATLDGKSLGTFGRFGCLSFHESKNIHGGLAGALLVNREDDFETVATIWERGTNRRQMMRGVVDKYTWVDIGSSFYPSELQAAFLLAQLEALDGNSGTRAALAAAYHEHLGPLAAAGHFALGRVDPGRGPNHHGVFILLNSADERERVRETLLAHGIQAVTHFEPLHSSPMGAALGYRPEDLPLTEDLALRLLRLPMHNNLTVEDVETVCRRLAACF